MDASIIILFAIVIVLGVVMFALITFSKRGGKLDVDKYRVNWLAIEQSLVKGEEATYHLAILNADKLVDQALRDRGYGGQTMGDRIKSTRGQLSHRNDLWTAHKLRNRIAHETGVRVSYDQTRRALSGFKHTLKDLGAI
ncbi:MAG: hypothetical protein H6797_02440 [Candidatus Nomurabacteria bacterium]|nr:MAG: hypothetical protein H6797_02440 [Candidatus Nomurabacteria bacterium]